MQKNNDSILLENGIIITYKWMQKIMIQSYWKMELYSHIIECILLRERRAGGKLECTLSGLTIHRKYN